MNDRMAAATTVTFLGTAAVVPGGGHDTATFVINGRYLVDCGWYAAIKMQDYGLTPLDLRTLILTHCHHDHYLGLPHLLFYRAMRRADAPGLAPLTILGPAGEIEKVVELTRRFLQAEERFPEAIGESALVPLSPGDAYEDEAISVSVCASLHPVPALCYRLTDKATGAIVGFTGDTGFDDSLAAHVRGAGLLITEASYGPRPAPEHNPWGHMGAPDAARLAKTAGVEKLALVHGAREKQADALEAARAIFPNTVWPHDGEAITVASPLAG